jgi:ankyrin repeat protein
MGHLDIVKLLLSSGADVDIHDNNNKTPLDLALDGGKLDVAKSLAEWMGGVDLQDRINQASLDASPQDSLPSIAGPSLDLDIPDEWRTSLHAASRAGLLDIVRSLLEDGADVNEWNEDHRTPLHCIPGVEIAKLLIEYGADVNSPDRTGWTPLHIALHYGLLDLVYVLLDHGADVNAKKQDHWTALHLATFNYSFHTVKVLLERGANVHARNDVGQTPFQIASLRGFGDQRVTQLLSEYGADVE